MTELKINLVRNVLKRNNYFLEISDKNVYSLQQVKSNSKNVQINYFVAIGMILTGVLILAVRSLWGVFFLATSIPMFKKVSKQKKKQKSNFGKKIIINENQIEISQRSNDLTIEFSSILEIVYDIVKSDDLSTGIVEVKTDKDISYPILEFFGEEKRYVEDDTKIVTQFIADVVNNAN